MFIKAINPSLPVSVQHVRQYKSRDLPTANYDVQMGTTDASEKIRTAFGMFWRKPRSGQAKTPIPPVLSNVSITISHTFATRVRVKIMKQMAKLHQTANPELSVFVTNYLPRPTLKIKHHGGRIDSYTYVESIKRFGHHLTREFLVSETEYARSNISLENLVPYFLVLSPDLIQTPQPPTPVPAPATRAQASKRGADQPITSEGKKLRPRQGRGKGAKGAKGQPATPASSSTSQHLATDNPFAVLTSPEAIIEKSFTAADSDVGDTDKSMAE